MPTEKDLKRLVRARMQKTGEAYTAARAQILRKPARPLTAPLAAPAPKPDYEKLTAMSNAAIAGKTGKTWEQWVEALDWHGAAKLKHRDIAALARKEFNVPDWWTQAVTVGYERIKGLRAIGQRMDGSFEANKSKTYPVSVRKLFDAWSRGPSRKRWLTEPGVTVRSATSPKAMRLKWSDGSTVVVLFTAKGKGRSAVAVQHQKLPDRATADRMKRYWADRFDALAALLE